MKIHRFALLLAFSIVLAGCGIFLPGESQDAPPQEPQPVPTQEIQHDSGNPLPQSTQNYSPAFSSALEDKFSGLAKEELAKILSVDASQITVVAITEMTWPNSSLGCPAPGVVYAQGRVPGYRIVLGIGDVLYTYHSDLVGQVLSCPSGDVREELPMGPTTAPEIGVPIK